jgi:hypothetical protein
VPPRIAREDGVSTLYLTPEPQDLRRVELQKGFAERINRE